MPDIVIPEWVIVKKDVVVVYCGRCGRHKLLPLPSTSVAFKSMGKAFVEKHKFCTDRAAAFMADAT